MKKRESLLEKYVDKCAAYRTEIAALRSLLRDLLNSGVELDDPRIGYVTMQVDRVTIEEARKALEAKP